MISRVLLRRTLVLPILVAALAACSDDEERGTGPGTFELKSPAQAAVTLAAGQATTVTIPVTFTGSMSAVTLTADSVPAGIRVGFQPSTITNGTEQVTVSITANPDVAAGTRTIKIIAKSPGMTDQVARIAVTTTGVASYTATNNTSTASPVTIKRGQTGTITVTLNRNGFTGPVDIIPDALPNGVTITPVFGVTGNTATLTISTTAAAAQTTGASFTIRATNPTIADRTMTVRYAITPEYTLSNSASTTANQVVIQKEQTGTATVTITRDTYQGPLTLVGASLPTGVSIDTVRGVAGNTATITIRTNEFAVGDTGSFLVTGLADGLQNQSTRVRYRINAAAGIVPVVAATQRGVQGNPDSLTLTINREGGYTGPVTVTLSNLPAGMTSTAVTADTGNTVIVPIAMTTAVVPGTYNITTTVSGNGVTTRTRTTAYTVQSRQLASGVAVTRVGDIRARGSGRTYRIEVPAGATQLAVTFTGGTGDGDLYVYDPSQALKCSSEEAANAESCTINNPAAGNWFVQLVVWNPYADGTLTATVTMPAATVKAGTAALRAPAATAQSTRHSAAELKAKLNR